MWVSFELHGRGEERRRRRRGEDVRFFLSMQELVSEEEMVIATAKWRITNPWRLSPLFPHDSKI
jgi:hypothetical protein